MIELILAEDIPTIAKTGDTVLLNDNGTFEIKKEKTYDTIGRESGNFPPTKQEEIDAREYSRKLKEKKDDIEKEFGGYKDFADCVSKNKDKNDPDAYCGSIKHKVEDVNKSGEIEKEKARKLQMIGYEKRLREKAEEKETNEKSQEKEDIDKECNSNIKKEYDSRIEKYLSIDKEKSWSILTKFYQDGHLDSYKVLKDFINKIATCPDVTEKFEKIMDGWMRDGEADISSIEKIINSCKKEGGNVVVEGDDKVAKAERSPEQLKQMEEARRRQQADDEDTKIKPIGKTAEIVKVVTKK